jgi:hypothetical protein
MGFWNDLFGGGEDPAKAANKYFDQIPDELKKYMEPYFQGGLQPGQTLNQIGQGYQQSPGFQFALQQALGASNRSAAAGGMAGTPAAQQNSMQVATGLANQDYNNWLQNALGIYGTGAEMGKNLGEDIGSLYGTQGKLAFTDELAKQPRQQQLWGGLISAAGNAAGGALGGPFGAMMGKKLFGGLTGNGNSYTQPADYSRYYNGGY